tara:strand:- start:185 stop:877 length:693 start_codon:yes stop_codon:yes gene_type:complete
VSFGPFKAKKSDYKATEAEKMEASVGLAQYNRNKEIYTPVGKKFMEMAEKDYAPTYTGRAAADAAQTLSTDLGSYQSVIGRGGAGFDAGSDYGSALLGQGTEANKAALAVQAALGSDAINSIINKEGITTSSISKNAAIQHSKNLSRAADKQKVRDAWASGIGTLAGAGASQGMQNRQDTGKFFTSGGSGDFSGQFAAKGDIGNNPNAQYQNTGPFKFFGGNKKNRVYGA